MFLPPSSALTASCRAAAELIAPLSSLDCSSMAGLRPGGSSSLPGRVHRAAPGRGSVATQATMYFCATETRKRQRRGRRGRRSGSGGSSDSDQDLWADFSSFGGGDSGSSGTGGTGGGGSASGGGGHAGYNGFGGEGFSCFVYENFWVWQLLCMVSLVQAAHHSLLGAASRAAEAPSPPAVAAMSVA